MHMVFLVGWFAFPFVVLLFTWIFAVFLGVPDPLDKWELLWLIKLIVFVYVVIWACIGIFVGFWRAGYG